MSAHRITMTDLTGAVPLSRRDMCALATFGSISWLAGCQVTKTSQDEAAIMRERAELVSGPSVERAKKVFDTVSKSGLVFKRPVRLTVFEGALNFPVFISDNKIGLDAGALANWPKNSQLAALFIITNLQQDFMSSPVKVKTYMSDRSAVEMGFDLTAADLLANIGHDPRAIRDVRRARVDVSEQQILSINTKLKSMGYQV